MTVSPITAIDTNKLMLWLDSEEQDPHPHDENLRIQPFQLALAVEDGHTDGSIYEYASMSVIHTGAITFAATDYVHNAGGGVFSSTDRHIPFEEQMSLYGELCDMSVFSAQLNECFGVIDRVVAQGFTEQEQQGLIRWYAPHSPNLAKQLNDSFYAQREIASQRGQHLYQCVGGANTVTEYYPAVTPECLVCKGVVTAC